VDRRPVAPNRNRFGLTYRRRSALLVSTLASIAIHAIVLSALFYTLSRTIVPRETPETVSQITIANIEEKVTAKNQPVRRVRPRHVMLPAPTRHELARETIIAPPQPPPRPRSTPSGIERDEASFSREVAQLNKANDPHAIPTIDPGSQESTMKSYRFDVSAASRGEEHGNGFITPTAKWHDRGLNCYYGRYEYTYPDGAQESGAISWAFCYQPGTDPFLEPPHPIPFPDPLAGYVLPPGTYLPPIEKEIYESWLASH